MSSNKHLQHLPGHLKEGKKLSVYLPADVWQLVELELPLQGGNTSKAISELIRRGSNHEIVFTTEVRRKEGR